MEFYLPTMFDPDLMKKQKMEKLKRKIVPLTNDIAYLAVFRPKVTFCRRLKSTRLNLGHGKVRHQARLTMILRRLLLVTLIFLSFSVPSALVASVGPVMKVSYRRLRKYRNPMHLPSDVALDGAGRMYLLDGTAERVMVFDEHGQPLYTLGGEGVLHRPLGHRRQQ